MGIAHHGASQRRGLGEMDPHLCRRPGPSLSGKDGACRISLIISLTGLWWAGGFALVSADVGACGGAGWSLSLLLLEPLERSRGRFRGCSPTPPPPCAARDLEGRCGSLEVTREASGKAQVEAGPPPASALACYPPHPSCFAQENKVCHCFHCFPIYLP